MRGYTLLFIAALAVSAHADNGFNTGGSGMSQGEREHDSSNPSDTKLLISDEQRQMSQEGRDTYKLPAVAVEKLDAILQAPNHSAFDREEIMGQVSYQQQPSGWDGRVKSNPQGKSSLGHTEGGSPNADGRTFRSATGSKTAVKRQKRTETKKPRNLNAPMSALEADSRRMLKRPRLGRPGAPGQYRSLRDEAPAMMPTERSMGFRDSEKRARKRLLDGEAPGAYSEIARSKIGQGRFDDAREAADKALDANPNDADAYALRAIASEQLGDETAKLAALEEAARLNPKRFGTLLKQARSGVTLFDPSAADSWHLLEALSHDEGEKSEISGKTIALILLGIIVFGLPLGAGITLYRRLSPEQQRRAVSWWRAASRGQVLPTVKTATESPVRKPDGASIVQLEPGLRIADKYKLVRRLGVDGTVEVWKALDCVLDRPVLLKRLYESHAESDEWQRRLNEAKQAAALHHPNVADLYEILDMPIGLFVVYEYPSGKTLRDIIDQFGPIPLLQAIDILIPVCRALQHAHHREIVHGALSPERVVLTRQGYIKVTDFILARTTASGGEAYVAPEAKRGDPTRASDIYSLGACLHELLTGAVPGLDGEEEPDARAEELLGRTLDLDGRTRIQSARVFQKELETLRTSLKKESGSQAGSSPREPVTPDTDQDDGSRNETTA